jgi:hypothetical protein
MTAVAADRAVSANSSCRRIAAEGHRPAKYSFGHFEIDQNGSPIAAGNPVNSLPFAMLSRHPSVIRFALTAARIGRHYALSPSSSTVWTWRSRRDTAARVPSGWICFAARSITQRCAA